MSGYGGITVALVPNGVDYFQFAGQDSDTNFHWAAAVAQSDKINPVCGGIGGGSLNGRAGLAARAAIRALGIDRAHNRRAGQAAGKRATRRSRQSRGGHAVHGREARHRQQRERPRRG